MKFMNNPDQGGIESVGQWVSKTVVASRRSCIDAIGFVILKI
jgi:hypothetical protein